MQSWCQAFSQRPLHEKDQSGEDCGGNRGFPDPIERGLAHAKQQVHDLSSKMALSSSICLRDNFRFSRKQARNGAISPSNTRARNERLAARRQLRSETRGLKTYSRPFFSARRAPFCVSRAMSVWMVLGFQSAVSRSASMISRAVPPLSCQTAFMTVHSASEMRGGCCFCPELVAMCITFVRRQYPTVVGWQEKSEIFFGVVLRGNTARKLEYFNGEFCSEEHSSPAK